MRPSLHSMVSRLAVLVATLLAISTAIAQDGNGRGQANPADRYRQQATARWSGEIAQLLERDQQEQDPEGGILFIGSSSIRLWDTIAEDVAPYQPIQRGYGGAQFSDLAVFAERIIHPHEYRALVMFVANDVTGGENDKTPEEIQRLVRYIIDVSRDHQPQAPVFLVEITPTASRLRAWPRIREVNAMLRELALTLPNTHFIPTAEHFLDAENQPIDRLFRDDRLHLNREGYHVWAKLIRRRLDDVLSTAE